MNPKHLLPASLREVLRPSYQRAVRTWRESRWSPTPREWLAGRASAWANTSPEALLEQAGTEFGITQVPFEILGLLAKLRVLQPKTIVEVGTHKGGNSFLFCHALSSAERIVGVDLCVQNAAKLIHYARPQQRYFALHGDSQTTQMKARVEQRLAGRVVDFLFIDGDHSYAGVKADFELYAPLVRRGGIIALHDIVADHRTRFGRDTGCYAGEVYQYWAELKARYRNEELVRDPEQDGFGIGVVYVD